MSVPKKITVFVVKKIVKMDPAIPSASAVAVADGKILSVGSLDELKPWLDCLLGAHRHLGFSS
jgi:predicted amidohydrolase YtcJ